MDDYLNGTAYLVSELVSQPDLNYRVAFTPKNIIRGIYCGLLFTTASLKILP